MSYIARKAYHRSHVSDKYTGKGKASASYIRKTIDSCTRACQTESSEEAELSKDSSSPSIWYNRAPSKGKAAPSKGYTSKGVVVKPSKASKEQALHKNDCCKGGVSFLKIKLTGIQGSGGSLTLGTGSPCSSRKGGISRKLHADRIQFIDCLDPCIDNIHETCETAQSNANFIEDGQVVCFASWNPRTDEIDLRKKMPLKIFLRFDNIEQNQAVFAVIHTSCADPVYSPYSIEMTTSCERSDVYQADTIGDTTSNPVLHFQDGMASSFSFELSKSKSSTNFFDSKFATCGCVCKETSSMPSSSPTISDICNENCMQWTSNTCIIPGNEINDEQPCISNQKRSLTFVSHERHVDLLQRLLDSGLFE